MRGQCNFQWSVLCNNQPCHGGPGNALDFLPNCSFPFVLLMEVAPAMHLFHLYVLAIAFRGQSNPGALILLPFTGWDRGGRNKNCYKNGF